MSPAAPRSPNGQRTNLCLDSPTACSKDAGGEDLQRSNGCFAMMAVSFGLTNPFVGVFTLFGMGLSSGGPSFVWGIFVVCIGQTLVCLLLMQLATLYPVAGSVYLWCRYLVGRRFGCFVGFIYLAALIGYCLPMAITTVQFAADSMQITDLSPGETFLWSAVVVVFWTLMNLPGSAAITHLGSVGMVLQVIAIIAVFVAMVATPQNGSQPVEVFLEEPPSAGGWMAGLCAPAWAFYGFEAAAAMAEEAKDPMIVPKTIAFALVTCFTTSLCLNVAMVLAMPDLDLAMAEGGRHAIRQLFAAHCPGAMWNAFNAFSAVLYLIGGLLGHSVATRILWSFARQGELLSPRLSQTLKVVDRNTQVPLRASCAVSGLLILLLLSTLIPDVNIVNITANFSTTGMYTMYQCCVIGVLYDTALHGLPLDFGGEVFHLGRATVPLCVCALIFGICILVNLMWPRDIVGGWTLLVSYVMVVVAGIVTSIVDERSRRASDMEDVAHSDESLGLRSPTGRVLAANSGEYGGTTTLHDPVRTGGPSK